MWDLVALSQMWVPERPPYPLHSQLVTVSPATSKNLRSPFCSQSEQGFQAGCPCSVEQHPIKIRQAPNINAAFRNSKTYFCSLKNKWVLFYIDLLEFVVCFRLLLFFCFALLCFSSPNKLDFTINKTARYLAYTTWQTDTWPKILTSIDSKSLIRKLPPLEEWWINRL